jgi:NADPH:quinone reductase
MTDAGAVPSPSRPSVTRRVLVAATGESPTILVETAALDPSGFAESSQLVEVVLVAADIVPLDRQIAAGKFPPAGPAPYQPGVSAVGRLADGSLVSVQGGHHRMGFGRPGCFADRFLAPSLACIPLPVGLDPLVAAAGAEIATTAHLLLHDHASLQPGERILVLGANGGVGGACVDLAHALGADVVAASRRPGDLDVPDGVRTVGYDAMAGLGANVIIDPIGGDVFAAAVLAGAYRCRHVFLGYPAGAVISFVLPLLMIAEHRIFGVNEHAIAESIFLDAARSALDALAAGLVRPRIASTFALADAATAFSSASTSGRTLLIP